MAVRKVVNIADNTVDNIADNTVDNIADDTVDNIADDNADVADNNDHSTATKAMQLPMAVVVRLLSFRKHFHMEFFNREPLEWRWTFHSWKEQAVTFKWNPSFHRHKSCDITCDLCQNYAILEWLVRNNASYL